MKDDPEVYKIVSKTSLEYPLKNRQGLFRIFGLRTYREILPAINKTGIWEDQFCTITDATKNHDN